MEVVHYSWLFASTVRAATPRRRGAAVALAEDQIHTVQQEVGLAWDEIRHHPTRDRISLGHVIERVLQRLDPTLKAPSWVWYEPTSSEMCDLHWPDIAEAMERTLRAIVTVQRRWRCIVARRRLVRRRIGREIELLPGLGSHYHLAVTRALANGML